MANKQDTDISLLINDVEDDELAEELAEAGEFEDGQIVITPDEEDMPFMPVGSIFVSAIPITDARVRLLDGSTIPQDGIYADFVNLIKSLVATGNNIAYEDDEKSTAEQKFNADVSATGNCGKFIIDDKNGTIRLPKITTFIQGLTDLSNIGHSLEAGIPNITSKSDSYTELTLWTGGGDTQYNGAINGLPTGYGPAGGSHGRFVALDFDASRSSAVYGKSTTVQPNATRFPYYIVLASGYKTTELVKIDNIVTELNNILKKMYPVGSIYTSNDLSKSPMNVLGFGTWERVVGRTIIGAAPEDGTDYSSFLTRSSTGYWYYADGAGNRYSMAVGAQSGTPNVALTTNEMPKHRHGPLYWNNGLSIGIGSGVNGNYYRVSSSTSGNTISTEAQTADTGGSKAHNNLPPYLAVYMWQRVE